MMNPVPWLQMTNMISYQGLVRTFPSAGSRKCPCHIWQGQSGEKAAWKKKMCGANDWKKKRRLKGAFLTVLRYRQGYALPLIPTQL